MLPESTTREPTLSMDATEFNQNSQANLSGTERPDIPADDARRDAADKQDTADKRGKISAMATSNGNPSLCTIAGETIAGETSASVTEPNGHRILQRRSSHGTRHLKRVPELAVVRDAIKDAAELLAEKCSQARPFSKRELERMGRTLLERTGQPEMYLGFAMVLIGNAFWRSRFLAIPFERRLLLLPPGVGHTNGCRAEIGLDGGGQNGGHNGDHSGDLNGRHNEDFSNDPASCGACELVRWQSEAERLGYQVLFADRSSSVLNTIVDREVEGILGVAHMDVLEKAIDKVLIAGVPSYVVPLPSEGEFPSPQPPNGTVSVSWLEQVLAAFEPQPRRQTLSYVPLMRAANRLFTDDFDRLLPRTRSTDGVNTNRVDAASPLRVTEAIAFDWLAHGGKRFRPFITLAAYDALRGDDSRRGDGSHGGDGSCTDDEAGALQADALVTGHFPDSVCRVAMAIEAFHKASLVHDDIQDDDLFRYGRETLHRSQGLGPAINIGDYLIGLGYRLVNSCFRDLGADVAADIVHSMADAHIKLCDGQGAEMAWRFDPASPITPTDALQLYALKTSPAFEAALYAGLRMAGPVDEYAGMIAPFARHLGVGFQVLNDVKDWRGDADNKLLAGQDALAIRPTMLLALALDAADSTQRGELWEIYQSGEEDQLRLEQLRQLFSRLGAFDAAVAIVDHARDQALALAEEVRPAALQRLLCFLVDTVLAPDAPLASPPSRQREEPAVQPVASS